MATIIKKQLAQARENSTDAVSVYTPPRGLTGVITGIRVCNTTSSPVKVRIFLDHDGTTYDESTALIYDMEVPANGIISDTDVFHMNNQDGHLAYRSETANALTVSVTGYEERK